MSAIIILRQQNTKPQIITLSSKLQNHNLKLLSWDSKIQSQLSWGNKISFCCLNILSWCKKILFCCCNILSWSNKILFCCLHILSWGNKILFCCLNLLSWGNKILFCYFNILAWSNRFYFVASTLSWDKKLILTWKQKKKKKIILTYHSVWSGPSSPTCYGY